MSVRHAVRTRGQDSSVRPFFVHWLSIPVVLSAGAVLHWGLGQQGWTTVVSVSVLLVLSAALSVYTWEAAAPRGQLVRGHATVTVSVNLALLSSFLVFGLVRPLVWLSIALSGALALSWNIRRMEAVRGEGKDGHGAGEDKFGLSLKKVRTLEKTPERARAQWHLGDGQTLESVQDKLLKIGSELGTIRKGTRVTATEREGIVNVTAIYRDVLKETKPWGGPTHPGGSITDGFNWGDYEDTEPVWIYPAGNYEKNVAPGHTGMTGMTRSGKGVGFHVITAEMSTRRDICPLIVLDERKGRQTTDNIDAAIGMYADTPAKIRAVLKGLDNAVSVRNQILGEHGYKSWTPECAEDPRLRMGALVFLGEEAATFVSSCGDTLIKILEAGLSAGIFGFLSAQLWKHDRVPTSLRSQIANVIAYGVGSTEDASYLLSDETIANGADPGQWGTRFPGRFVCELNGVEIDRYSVQAKGYLGSDQQLQDVTDEWGPRMIPYDRWTLAAFGTAYEPYVQRRTSGLIVPATRMDGLSQLKERMEDMQVDDAERAYQEDTRLTPEEEDGLYGVPEMDDEELARLAAAVDLEDPLPDWTGGEVDMSPPATAGARKWTMADKRLAFAAMMLRFAQEPGGMARSYKTSELYEAWIAELGCEREAMAPERLHDLLSEARERGEMEPEARGRWRIITLVEHTYTRDVT